MASFDWFRSWHGAPMDHKWQTIAVKAGVKVGIVSAVAWALMDYASQHAERGTVTGFDEETYAVYSGFPESEIHAVIAAMTDKGFIEDGHLRNWLKRQPKREGDSSERVARFREMKRNVTQCNTEAEDVTISSTLLLSDSLILNGEQKIQPPISGGWQIRVFAAVTGMMSFPGNETDKILPALDGLFAQHGNDEAALIEYLRPYWAKWLTTKGKNGQPYKKTNCAWLYEWAVAGEMPGESAAPHYAEVF